MQTPEPTVEGQLKGKVALVSGAASGIGRASAMLFAQAGASVVALDRAAEVEDTVASIRKDNGRALAVVTDSSREDNICGTIDTAMREFGALDVCFANAGISGGLTPLHEQTPEHWLQVLTINLIGTFLAVKHAARVMTPRNRGSIICTASVAQSAAARWRSHRDCTHGAVPGVRSGLLRQRPGVPGRWWPVELAPHRAAEVVIPRM